MTATRPIDTLKREILEFASRNPGNVCTFTNGHRLITEGEEGNDFYLVRHGSLSILVNDFRAGKERHIAMRFEGDLIGETAILQRRGMRNASLEVTSPYATLVKLSRKDVLELLKRDAEVTDAIVALWELAAARRSETLEVLRGGVRVENKVMSVLLADIHNFSTLGETVWEELSELFLFEFMESSEAIAKRQGAHFEDQGDGFKAVFEGGSFVNRAVECAALLQKNFHELRRKWIKRSEAFSNIGLGIGVCTDCMSICRQLSSAQTSGRIVSHAMNIASALSKQKADSSEVDAYLDDTTASLMRTNEFSLEPAEEVWLERMGRKQVRYKLIVPSPERAADVAEITALDVSGKGQITILFLSADPSDEARLPLGEEVREIEEKLRLSRHRDRFAFHQRHAVRPADLIQALLDHQPQIVHFSGHGAGITGLCLEGQDGRTHLVTASALSSLFREFAEAVQCVILNACYSEHQANAIAVHIKYVIGMTGAIGDVAAIAFTNGFYQALGAGKVFEDAYRLGRVQVELVVPTEELIPVLKKAP